MTTALPDPTRLPDRLATGFDGTRGAVFRLALTTGALTVLTLGLYRFRARTRLRRYYWSAITPGGQPLEYTGTGSEKLAGLCFSVAVLAAWLGLVCLLPVPDALAPTARTRAAVSLALPGLLPLWYYSRYRVRAYLVNRIRWRAIGFGMAPGAAGYAMLASWCWIATLLTFGALWPRMTFRLEAYLTDRTRFGTVRLIQTGRWQRLQPAFAQAYVAGLLTFGTSLVAIYDEPRFGYLLWGLVPWFCYGIVFYRVEGRRLLTEAKRAVTAEGEAFGFEAAFAVPEVARIVGFGAVALGLVLLTPLALIAFLVAVAVRRLDIESIRGIADPVALSPGAIAAAVALALGAVAVIVLASALRHAFVSLPLWHHHANGLVLTGTAALLRVDQEDPARAGRAAVPALSPLAGVAT